MTKVPLPAPTTTVTDARGQGSAKSASAKGIPPVPSIQQERILQHAWHLKKNGYRESTITGRVKLLRSLARRVDLFDPEGVKGAIGFCALQIPLLNFLFAVEVVSLLEFTGEKVSLALTLILLEFSRS